MKELVFALQFKMHALRAVMRSSCGLGAVLLPSSSKGSSASIAKCRCTSCPPIV